MSKITTKKLLKTSVWLTSEAVEHAKRLQQEFDRSRTWVINEALAFWARTRIEKKEPERRKNR